MLPRFFRAGCKPRKSRARKDFLNMQEKEKRAISRDLFRVELDLNMIIFKLNMLEEDLKEAGERTLLLEIQKLKGALREQEGALSLIRRRAEK